MTDLTPYSVVRDARGHLCLIDDGHVTYMGERLDEIEEARSLPVTPILDRDGRRLFPQHRNWLQLRPGETRTCNGCHQATTPDASHGRDGTSAAAWASQNLASVQPPVAKNGRPQLWAIWLRAEIMMVISGWP